MPTIIGNQKSGIFREIHGIVTAMEPADKEVYRSLLPTALSVPTQPIVSIYVASFDQVGGLPPFQWRPYLEGAIRLRCAYEGEEGWFVKTMPVTSRISTLAGRSIGFPKYIADQITLNTSPQCSTGEVKHKGTLQLRIEFMPGFTRDLTPQEQKVLEEGQRFWDPYYFLVPRSKMIHWVSKIWRGVRDAQYVLVRPDENPALLRIGPKEVVPSTGETSETGTAHITVNPAASWAGLISTEKSLPGIMFHWKGGVVMVVQKLY